MIDGKPLGVGIVGAGAVTQSIHLPALASLPTRFRVRHVVDASSAVAASVGDRVGARHGTDVSALLDDPDVDVVLVATPDSLHPCVAIDACRAGKRAVLVEKPIALTPGEANAIAAESAATGVPVVVGTMHVHDPAFVSALPLIGEASAVTIETIFGPNEAAVTDTVELITGPPDTPDAVAQMMTAGAPSMLAGVEAGPDWFAASLFLLGLSSHDLAILRAAHGEPTAVSDARVLRGFGVHFVLAYESGLTAAVTAYSTNTKFNSWRARWLSGDRVVDVSFPVSYSPSAGSVLEVHERDDRFCRTERWSDRNETGFRREWLHLHDVVLSGAEPTPSAASAAADVALIQRIIRAGAGTAVEARPERRRVAVAGGGWIAAVHAPQVAGLGHQVTLVASRTRRSAERLAWPHAARAQTFDEFDPAADVDVVIVGGPPATHAAHTLAALEAGKVALVEKPLTTTLADADRILAAGGQVGYLENWAFAPVVTSSIAAVRAGGVGDLRRVEVRCLHSRPAWGMHFDPWWGGGCLYDLGPHPVWWAMALLGEPVVRLRATLADDDTRGDVTMETARGTEAVVAVSWQQSATGPILVDATVTGASATLRAELDPKSGLSLDPGGPVDHREQGGPRIAGFARKAGYVQQLDGFLGDDWTRLPSAGDGRAVLEVICAAYASAGRHGEWVDLPFTGPQDLTPLELWRRGTPTGTAGSAPD